jgi:hypothetical protein
MTNKILFSSLLSLSSFFARRAQLTKRFVTTTMASSIDESTKTKNPDKKRDNLLAKRYIGLEKNIW